MSPRQAISYARVSTARQGASGLGLDAQRTAVTSWAKAGGHSLVTEFVEVESGKRDDRPQLTAALAACKLHRATLVIAKLDRLARNVAFIANLMDCGVDFIACDMPHANRLTLHLMAAMAEYEAAAVSERTKAALAAAKARGVRLGNPNGAVHLLSDCRTAAARSAEIRRRAAVARAHGMAHILAKLRASGIKTAPQLANALNKDGVPSPNGGSWHAQQVRRIDSYLLSHPSYPPHPRDY